MTLEEAIKHCEEVAQEKRYEYQECLAVHDTESAMDCKKCGEEHEQLAKWLKELREWKKLIPVCGFDGYVVYKCKEKKDETD